MAANPVHGRHYATGQPCLWDLADGRIRSCTPASSAPPGAIQADWIAPAFFDIQVNGGLGISFNAPSLTVEQVEQVAALCRSHGISQFFPTLVTASLDDLAHGFRTLNQAITQSGPLAHAIPGFHLEGPFISPEDGPRGAHPRQHVRPPSWEEFQRLQEAAGGRIRLLTLAPEKESALPFIKKAAASGVVIALGHTAASSETIRAAVSAGARLSTHLGNGSHAVLPRHENYFLEQLADDRLIASIISDGHHLPLSLLRILIRVKGPKRLILTCDASSLAGLPPGRHAIWGQEFDLLPSGKIVVPGTSFLGGAGVFTDACVSVLLGLGELSVAEVLDLAGNRPRELMGLPPRRLEAGEPAEMVAVNQKNGTWEVKSL